MTLHDLILAQLGEIYLGKTIKTRRGKEFVVDRINILYDSDPAVEILFSDKSDDAWYVYDQFEAELPTVLNNE